MEGANKFQRVGEIKCELRETNGGVWETNFKMRKSYPAKG
jgi:hypothetical protein